VYLNCHTYYSLKFGTLSLKNLFEEAERCGVKTFALTDINNTSVAMDYLRLAPNNKIRPVLGVDFRNSADQQFVALAKNIDGFKEINDYLSQFLTTEHLEVPADAPPFKNAWIIYPLLKCDGRMLRRNEFIGVTSEQLNTLDFFNLKYRQNKIVALQSVTFRNKRDFNAHRLLRAIDNNTLLSRLPKEEEAQSHEIMHPEKELQELFKGYPKVIENTYRLLNTCKVELNVQPGTSFRNQKSYTGNDDLDYKLIRKLAYAGIKYRYPKPDDAVFDRIEQELVTIKNQGFVSYFLITWRILKYARSKNYFYVGRGSGANSIVSYLLRITDVDPIELNLYFERFINLFRKSPPDFDIDFSWQDRQDVTRYIFERFKNVTLLGAYITFQFKSVFRELGKVFGLPADDIIMLQRNPNKADEIGQLIIKYSHLIHGFPSHLSVHSAGVLIAEEPITNYTATFLPPKGFVTTHFDMIVAEDIGLFKWDILGQRGLAKIKDALTFVKENKNEELDIHNVKSFYVNDNCNKLLQSGQAIGCFYIESPAMRMLLKKLRVNTFLGLVAASSVIRPGVAKSGMMREYILRHRNPEKRNDAHPTLRKIMPETYGVMVYQEDVIKVAHIFAGLSLSEADVLRRGMSGKFRSRDEFKQVELKFFSNCRKKGYAEQTIAEIWRQIESFAGYAFAKGHSASYAVESYQCLYLKAYYPLEYMVATINNGGGFYSRELYLHEAKQLGATLELPCINLSEAKTIILDTTIYVGFAFVKGLETTTVVKALKERLTNGFYTDFRDFTKRVKDVSLEQTILMIRAGLFRKFGISKKQLLWDAHYVLNEKKPVLQSGVDLFQVELQKWELPKLTHTVLEDAFDEIELLGYPMSISPFELIKEPIGLSKLKVSDMLKLINKSITLVAYLIHVKTTTTQKREKMQFGTFIDLNGKWLDTVHFPNELARYPFRGPGCYNITGIVTQEFDYLSLEVKKMTKLELKNLEE
tara:strand:+ start:4655 stop:7597 length:2943 start_codon:yes stop_codon:yes gene_type:complete